MVPLVDYSCLSREQLIQRLRAQEQISVSYHLLMEQAPDGIFIADTEGNYVDVNQAGTAILGYTREEILALNIADIILPEEVSRIPEEVARYIDGAIVVAEWRIRRKDGSTFLGEVVGRRLPDGRLQGVLRDITERRQAESERLVAMERQRDALVREVHHRIKNHLQGVNGLLRGLAQEYPESAAPLGEAIERVRAIAQVYGLQSCRQDAQVRLCDLLRTAAEGVVGSVSVSSRLPPAGTEAILAPAETVPLALVVNELLTNAVKHLDPPDPQRPVRVSLDILPDEARAEIRSGPARLPAGFDFAQRSGCSTGLELLRALLPPEGATLRYREEGDDVVAELVLAPPVVTLVIA